MKISRIVVFNITICFIYILLSSSSACAEEAAGKGTPYGGEIVASLYATPTHLNPAIQSGLATAFPGVQIFAGLVRFDDKWTPQPYLAKSWTISDNGLAVTLNLVENAVFHDGVPITSEDVAFSIMAVKAHHPFKSMMAPITRVETPEPHKVIIHLVKPHPALFMAMSPPLLPILPKHIYKTVENVVNNPANMNPVGSGPFKIEAFIPGKEIRLVKNDAYFIKGRPYLDRITIKIIRLTLEEGLGMETGEIQMMLSFQDINELNNLRAQKHLYVMKDSFKGIGPIYWLAFNIRHKPLSDVRVRQAFAYAIDRDLIVDTLFKGETIMETGPISTNNPLYSSDVNRYDLDIDKANRLLDEAGYPRDAVGKRFSIRLTYLPERSEFTRKLIEYIQQVFLTKLGVETVVEHPGSLKEWIGKISNWDFDMTTDDVFNWGDPVIGVHRTYLSSNIRKGVMWSNTQGYANPVVDKLLEEAATELDFEKRYHLYKDFQRIIMEDLPVYPLFQPFFAFAYDKRIGGISKSIWGAMTPFDTVYWENKP